MKVNERMKIILTDIDGGIQVCQARSRSPWIGHPDKFQHPSMESDNETNFLLPVCCISSTIVAIGTTKSAIVLYDTVTGVAKAISNGDWRLVDAFQLP